MLYLTGIRKLFTKYTENIITNERPVYVCVVRCTFYVVTILLVVYGMCN